MARLWCVMLPKMFKRIFYNLDRIYLRRNRTRPKGRLDVTFGLYVVRPITFIPRFQDQNWRVRLHGKLMRDW